jgi:hypothetical protein
VIARLRRLLVIPAVGLVLVGAPALAVDRPEPPAPTTTEIPMAGALEADAGSVWTAEADVAANLVGVEWSGDPGTEFTVEVRNHGGDWKPVGAVGPVDVAPDPGSPDARSAARHGGGPNKSEPLWIGKADGVRVTASPGSGSGGAVANVTLAAVSAPDGNAPKGSAGALGPTLLPGPDRYGYGLALVLSGLALGAFAHGWTPRCARRAAALAAVAGLVVLAACDPVPPAPSTVAPPQPAITTHAQWGPGLGWNPSPDCAPGPTIAGEMKFAVVHHTVNANSYGPGESAAIVRAIWQYHVGTLGYCDIAYNFLVDRYGKIFEGRMGGIDRAVVAAHTGGFNTGSTGAAFIGDFTAEQPPVAAWNAMVSLLAWKLSVHHVDPTRGFTATSGGAGSRWPEGTVVSFPNAIVGHRDLWPTACPGEALYPRVGELRNAVQPQIGWEGGGTTATSPVRWIPES